MNAKKGHAERVMNIGQDQCESSMHDVLFRATLCKGISLSMPVDLMQEVGNDKVAVYAPGIMTSLGFTLNPKLGVIALMLEKRFVESHFRGCTAPCGRL